MVVNAFSNIAVPSITVNYNFYNCYFTLIMDYTFVMFIGISGMTIIEIDEN